jgi:hypothetical protein
VSLPVTAADWHRMSGEEQDALIASGWHPGPDDFAVVRHAINQLTDHGSQGCLDCLKHRQDAFAALDRIEARFIG